MSVTTSRNRGRAGRLTHLIAAITIATALGLTPPALPRFGPSLVTPLTTSTLSRLALLLAWIALVVLALALLRRALIPTRALLPPWWAIRPPRRAAHASLQLRREAPAPLQLLITHRAAQASDGLSAEVDHLHEPTDSAMPSRKPVATIRLLGPVTIEGVRRPRRASTVELLAYLALHPAGASRDELLEAMWPGQDPRRTRPRLWQSASEARRLLGDAFERDGERYRLDPAQVATDIAKVDDLLQASELSSEAAHTRALLERAAAKWRGRPLAGADYPWAAAHTRQLTTTLADLLERAGHVRLQAGDPHGALEAAEQALELDDLNETFLRLALKAEAALGQRKQLNERYEAFQRLLDSRLGLKPERKTRLLLLQLLGPSDCRPLG